MRLEIGHAQQDTANASGIIDARDEERRSEAASALREGIRAAQAGDRANARSYLLRASELDPSSESAWLWLASISEYPEELLVFLNNVLEINPRNARANEWMRATKALLSKTFVQRGIDAASEGRSENALQYFNQALENDQSNSTAWLWLARLADSDEGRMTYLEKALELDPENSEAREEFEAIRRKLNQALLAEARAAAVAGRKSEANELLDAFIAEFPESEDGWILRAHLADCFDEKIAAFERVIEINPENLAARAGLDSLRSILETVAPPISEPEGPRGEISAEPGPEMLDASVDAMENIAFAIDQEREIEESLVHDKSPTQELVFPKAALNVSNNQSEQEDDRDQQIFADDPIYFDDPSINVAAENEAAELGASNQASESRNDDPNDKHSEGLDWSMNTVAFSFSFPGGDAAADELPKASTEESVADPEIVQVEANEEALPDFDFNSTFVAPSFDPAMRQLTEMFDSAASFDSGRDDTETDESESETAASSEVETESVRYDLLASPFDAKADDQPSGNLASQAQPEFVYSVMESDEPEIATHEFSGIESADYATDSQSEPIVENAIPMPVDFGLPSGFPLVADNAAAKDRLTSTASLQKAICPFCKAENPGPVFTCNSCLAILTLADLEMLLGNNHADRLVIRSAIDDLESLRNERELTETELTTLGIGYLNLREFQQGFLCLQEASRKNPDNVLLAGQVNSLLIRLEEISQQEDFRDASPKPHSVLVVDDSATVRKLIAGKLEKSGYQVFAAADGIEALEMLKTVTPDLILLDITMPRMDGYQVCKVIRGMESTKDTPVIMISGKDGFFDKVRGRMAGTTGYITKPFGPETLMKAIESYLNGQNA